MGCFLWKLQGWIAIDVLLLGGFSQAFQLVAQALLLIHFNNNLLVRFSSLARPHAELNMAPHVGFDTDHIKDKARKDLLYLLEGVSKGYPSPRSGRDSC